MEEFQRELSVVEEYLLRGTYPDGFSKAEKANLKQKCRNNFKIEDGVLHYRKNGGNEKEENQWRVCVRSEEEKARILESCQSGVAGIISYQILQMPHYRKHDAFPSVSPKRKSNTASANNTPTKLEHNTCDSILRVSYARPL